MQQERVRTPTPPAPATSGPTTARTATAPSNAARQENLGLGAPQPECAAAGEEGGLAEALRTMGEMGAVVLDALPAPDAIALALPLIGLPWVVAWLGRQSWKVLEETGALKVLLDQDWPVGVAVEGAFEAEVDAAAGFPFGTTYRVDRTEKGFVTTAGFRVGAEIGEGGAELKGAFGEALLAAGAKFKVGHTVSGEAEWFVATPEACKGVEGDVAAAIVDLAARVTRVLLAVLGSGKPRALRLHEQVDVSAGAEAANGFAAIGASTTRSGSGSIGYDDGKAFFELAFGADGRAKADAELFGLLPMAGLELLAETGIAGRGSLRVELDKDSFDQGVIDPSRFVLSGLVEMNGRIEENRVETRDAATLIEAVGLGRCDQVGCPDVDLRKSVEVPVEEEQLGKEMMPQLVAIAEDHMPDRHFVAGVSETVFSTQVLVTSEAVAAAWRGAPPYTDAEEVLDAERALAAPYLQSRVEGFTPPEIGAGLALVRLEHSEVRAKARFGAGIGGSAAAGLKAGASGAAELAVEVRKPADEVLSAEQQKALLAG